MRFRPCIDLRKGKVVQIVGGSLNDNNADADEINFETERSSEYFAGMYKRDGLKGGHVISLGSENREAALSALMAYPGGLQAGGGIDPENAGEYLDAGASHVIVTSYLFSNGEIDYEKLSKLVGKVGRERLVIDLSCRKRGDDFVIVADRWQTFTDVVISNNTLEMLSEYCDEYLVHGVDVEGKRQGIEEDLVEFLGQYCPVPVTYAGGIKTLSDMDLIKKLGKDRVDATIGSSLDIFGGDISYREVVEWHDSNCLK
ncbi:phosphoribosylformimino-5-aminoimidazole carboxamide ribotide isomerase [Thermodesulfobacteriota bacterium]